MRALISVHDKRNLEQLARGLAELGVEIISTGGTFDALTGMGVEARSVADVTGFPEILEGRVKTLHPAIHAGILADRSKPAQLQELEAHGITPMHEAAQLGRADIIELLLANGAEINSVDDAGRTPLVFAIRGKHDDLVAAMKARGARVELKEEE